MNYLSDLANVSCPIIPLTVAEKTAQGINSSLLNFIPVADAGHGTFYDHPEIVFSLIRDFIVK